MITLFGQTYPWNAPEVLLLGGDTIKIGAPVVAGAEVEARLRMIEVEAEPPMRTARRMVRCSLVLSISKSSGKAT